MTGRSEKGDDKCLIREPDCLVTRYKFINPIKQQYEHTLPR